jgi:hypothetical protein
MHLIVVPQIAWAVFAGFELALLIIWSNQQTRKNRAEVPSAAISFIGAIILGFLSFTEHMRSVRPSFLLTVYLLFTSIFDIERSRSYALSPDLDLVATLFAPRLGVKVFLAVVEARDKRRLLLPDFVNSPPEATSGVYKRATFWWLNSLFKKGFSTSLTIDDLFQLDKHLQADYLHHLIGSSWARGRSSLSFGIHVSANSENLSCKCWYSLSLCNDVEEVEMANTSSRSTKIMPNRLQLLPAIPNRKSGQLFSGGRHGANGQYWLWIDWRIHHRVHRHCSQYITRIISSRRLC